MSLRIRLFVPLVVLSLVLLAYISGVLVPRYLERERGHHMDHFSAHLDTLAEGLVSPLLQGDLSALHFTVNNLMARNRRWVGIVIADPEGRRLYPIETRASAPAPNAVYERVERNVTYRGRVLATIRAEVDLTDVLREDAQNFANLTWVIVVGVALLALAIAITVEVTVRRPLMTLVDAARKVARGDYEAPLPAAGGDEVGTLAGSFRDMRNAVRDNEQGILQEVKERRLIEARLRDEFSIQSAIGSILRLAMERVILAEILHKALLHILAIPFMGMDKRGCVVIANEHDGKLVVQAQIGLDETLRGRIVTDANTRYRRQRPVAAAAAPTLTGAGDLPVELPHTVCVPIATGARVLGALYLVTRDDGSGAAQHGQALRVIADTLAGVVERKRAEMAVDRAKAELENRVRERTAELQSQKFAMDQHSIVTISDADGHITYVNDLFCAVSQFARHEMIGQDHRVLNSGHHPAAFFADLWQTVLRGEVWKGEIRNRRKDGSHFWVDTTIVPFLDEQGRPYQFVSIRTDITALKNTEVQVRQARDAAVAATLAKSSFLATMSHEIRTPMNGVIGMLSLMQDCRMDDEASGYMDTARQAAAQLLAIVNNVLDFSKVEAGRVQLERIAFDPTALTEEVVRLYAAKARIKGVALSSTLAPDVPARIEGDPTRLRQVLGNLVDNAIKFTEAGEVQVRVSSAHQDGAEVTLRYEVSDTGPGMDGATRERLFEPFSQADSSTTRRYGGTGLGLAIVKRLVEQMQGQVGVASVPGEGSVFWFTLKAGRPPVEEQGGVAGRAGVVVQRWPGAKVLIADDNDINRLVAERMLERVGVSTTSVASGDEVLRLWEDQAFDLVLMDCQMPVMDGYQTTGEIRLRETRGQRPHTPIVAMTANALAGDRERCLAAGMDGYLVKPLMADELAAVLQRWVGQGRIEPQAPARRGAPGAVASSMAVDPDAITELQGLMQDQFGEFVSEFLSGADRYLQGLGDALGVRSAERVRELAHALKGSSANVGAAPLSALCGRLERAARADALDEADAILPELAAELARVRAALTTSEAAS